MTHSWHFFRSGGVDQVSLRDAADLAALPQLDPKLWVALAMPTTGVDVDPATLKLIDTDNDGRIRMEDVLATVEWIGKTWKDPGAVLKGSESLSLSAIADPKVARAAKQVLKDVGKADAKDISLADIVDVAKVFAATKLNGDGIVTPDTASDDAATKQVIEEAIAAVGALPDRSGKDGIDQAKVDAFFKQLDELAAWAKAGEDAAIRPAGDATEAAADALAAVKAKIADHFARARLAAYDGRAAAALDPQEATLKDIGGRTLASDDAEIAKLPLARVEAGRPLPLKGALNPAWAPRIAAFVDKAVTPLLGARDALTEADFQAIVDKLAAFEAWRASKPAHAIKLELPRVRELAGGDARNAVAALIAQDKERADDYAEIAAVEKLMRLQRDFGRVLRNFVNFSDFYGRKDGVFQAGTLYLDARAAALCVPVSDAGKHGALAQMSSAYLVYCDCVRGAEKRQIAAAFTNGDADHLVVGRNGVFYDRKGDDWDATITKIVSNPISVREAFWAPYKKLVRMIEETVSKRAQAAEAAADAKVAATATKVGTADQAAAAPPAGPPAPAPAKKIDVGTVAAIGVAIGGIGALIVGMLSAFLGLGLWMPIGLLALLLMISGPSMLLAWMKLRQRNLGPILDANGWAINGRARINVAFGAALTSIAALPKGSKRTMDDPYADKRTPWRLYTFGVVLIVLASTWYIGRLDGYLPQAVKSTEVLGSSAPAAARTLLFTPPGS
jgi:hypothetical protein